MLDIAVVGAGPCALALVSRLACQDPDCSSNFIFGFDSITEPLSDTLSRLSSSSATTTSSSNKKGGPSSIHDDGPFNGKLRVFDSSGSWLGRWNDLFRSLDIKHLRSPHVAHPCPTHSLALLAHAEDRKKEFGVSKDGEAFADFHHLHYHGCHRAPSTDLFESLCHHICDTLHLHSLIEEAKVTNISPVSSSTEGDGKAEDDDVQKSTRNRFFRLTIARPDGTSEVVESRAVVIATGSADCPRIPDWMMAIESFKDSSHGERRASSHATEHQHQHHHHPAYAFRHAWDLPQDLKSHEESGFPIQAHERILVIGGGLTAVQLTAMAKKAGCRQVWPANVCMASRRPLQIQQFDAASAWMDRRQRPALLRRFMQADLRQRLQMIQNARGIASIPPEALSLLKGTDAHNHCITDPEDEVIQVWENTEVIDIPQWVDAAQAWRVMLERPEGKPKEWIFERIWCATGSEVKIDDHPLLGPFFHKCPIPCCGGFPCLTSHLAWSEDCELYVLGAPAALTLGPDAFNLNGARTGACRAGHVLKALLSSTRNGEDEEIGHYDKEDVVVTLAKKQVSDLRFRYDSKYQRVKGQGLPTAIASEGKEEASSNSTKRLDDPSLATMMTTMTPLLSRR